MKVSIDARRPQEVFFFDTPYISKDLYISLFGDRRETRFSYCFTGILLVFCISLLAAASTFLPSVLVSGVYLVLPCCVLFNILDSS
jgi:hypothetical protein